jgi:hypothetical protein
MISTRSLLILGLAALSLTACGDVREDLGLGRNAPDEFAVVDQPPLSMPPDFDLRPPQPGAARPQAVDMKQRANDVLFNGSASSTKDSSIPASDAEKALLEKTGADKADPNIRQVVDREAAQKVVSSPHLVDQLLWWKKEPPPGTTVDAAAEAARIKEAKDKGEPLNKGATPVIERQKTGWLGL